jgi:acetoin utilization protein AcuA
VISKLILEQGTVLLEGPVSKGQILSKKMCSGLASFRSPAEQQKALADIAGLPEGMVYIAHIEEKIIGYITFHYPDPLERWGQIKIKELLEFGAIEVCPGWRNKGIAKSLLRIGFSNPVVEDYIIISTEYYWHWDLEGTGLNVWEYKSMIECALEEVGFQLVSTDDPEIISHPANSLMVRYGENVLEKTVIKFESYLFLNKRMF